MANDPLSKALPPLGPDEIRVLSLRLDRESELPGALSPEERDRAERMGRPELRRRFVAARDGLRRILAAHVGTPPEALEISIGEGGKPALPGGPSFNLSHSGDVALVALARRVPVGVDVEVLRNVARRDALARRFFTEGEVRALAGAPAADADRAFLRCWTRKEAYLKAVGRGIAGGLGRAEVSLAAEAAFVRIDGSAEAAAGWLLRDVSPDPGSVAAVAAPGTGFGVRLAAWPP